MILFFNVLVTDTRSSVGGMNRVDRLDLFKYALASYACIDIISSIIIYCELGGNYKAREGELRDYIDFLFPCVRHEFHSVSPSTQREWQLVLSNSIFLTTDEPILYMGNDDHIFIDYDLDMLHEGINLMMAEPRDQINTLHISSWTEGVSTIYGLNDFKLRGRYWEAELLYSDASQIVNSAFFRHVFFDLDMGNDYMRRTDNFLTNWYPYLGDYRYPSRAPHPKVKTFLPLRELVRHFDAYWHINVPLEYCPLLQIPEGFWDRSIKVKPSDGNFPLFWKDRIIEVEHYPDGPEYIEIGNISHRLVMTAPHSRVYQNPNARAPAIWPTKFRDLGNGWLPLEEKYITIGMR